MSNACPISTHRLTAFVAGIFSTAYSRFFEWRGMCSVTTFPLMSILTFKKLRVYIVLYERGELCQFSRTQSIKVACLFWLLCS